ncbi:MAG: PQQ-dependent sugar dehydrogenase [Pseudomonadota bacterium]
MIRKIHTLAAVLGLAIAAPVSAETHSTSAGPVEITPVVRDLETPWAVAFLPDGRFLITERDGALLLVEADGRSRRSIAGVPEVRASGQGGLLDVALDPDFSENRRLYLSFSDPVGVLSARTAVASARLSDHAGRLEDVRIVFRQDPDKRGGRHFGSRIVPDGKGNLFITTGDRGDDEMAQTTTHIGKVIRIRADGAVPEDNPFRGTSMPPEVWSLGHRNPQGAALDENGRLWTVSHGARGGDEINRPEAGKNYGWPVISYGRQYMGGKIGIGTEAPGMEQPVFYWDPSIAPSGMMIYSGKLWPDWAGDIFVGSLKMDFLSRLDRDGDGIGPEERLLQDAYLRIRDVREGPNGAIWFLAEGDGALYRMTPLQ